MRKTLLLLVGLIFTASLTFSNGANEAKGSLATGNQESFTLQISTTGVTDDNIDIAEKIFMKRYPNAKIEYVISPWSDTREKQLVLVAMDDIPDIAKTGGWAQEFYKDGILDDLSSEIKTWDIYNAFTPGQLERMKYNDEICALNYNTNTFLLLYNKDILKKIGAEVPKSFKDLEEIGRLISKKDLKNSSGKKVFVTTLTTHPWEIGAWIWSNDGVFMNDSLTKTLIDSPESIKAHSYAQSFIKNGWAPLPDGTMDQLWLNGQLATYLTGEWTLPATIDAGLNVGVTTVPVGAGGYSISATGGCDWVIFKNSKNKEKAYEFLNIMYSDEFQIQADRGVTNLKIYKNEAKIENWKETGIFEAKMAQFKQLKTTKYQYMDGPYKFPDGRSIYIEALERMFFNMEDPKTVLKTAAEKINSNY